LANNTSSKEADSNEEDAWDDGKHTIPSTPKVPEFIQFNTLVVTF